MKRTLMALLVVGTLGSLVVLAPAGKRTVSFVPVAHEQDQNDGCSLASLQGTYALEREGTIVAQLPGFPAPPAPLSEVLIATFNGAGSFSGITTANVGGVVLNSAPFTGT